MTGEELNAVRNLQKQIRALEKNVHGLKMLAENIVPILDGLPHSTDTKSRVENIALKIVEREHELDNLREEYLHAKERLTNKILSELGEDPILQTLLILYYVECLSFRETARRMGYTLRHVFRLHENQMEVWHIKTWYRAKQLVWFNQTK